MEITKEMLIAEFKRQIDFANFMESNHTSPFRKEFLEYALTLIKAQSEEITTLGNAKYIFSTVDYCSDDLANALEENKRLTAEVERLKKSYRLAVQDNADTCQLLFKAEDELKQIKTRTVMEMARRLGAETIIIQDHTGKLGSVVLVATIDKIAKEMIGETK